MSALLEVIPEARRVLKRLGVAFLNLGDVYHSRKGQITRTNVLREFVRDRPCHTCEYALMLAR